jgi:uncharacterized tellurite resistance protein B-like protein
MSAVGDRIEVLIDIFLGAAYADRQLAGRERVRIQDLVQDLMCTRQLPPAVQGRIDSFAPDRFDLQAAARQFAGDPPMSQRRLLELVAQVMAADDEYDLAEDEYLRALAAELGVPSADFQDLTLEYEVNELRESFEQLRKAPPPVPPK